MKVGDKVKLYLIEEIKKAKKLITPSVLELWEAIDNLEGVITEINGDDIWVKGNNTGLERKFNKETLKMIE